MMVYQRFLPKVLAQHIIFCLLSGLSINAQNSFIYRDFNDGMANSKNYNFDHARGDTDWKRAKYLFDKTISDFQEHELRIPKIIHQIWLGGSFPEKCKALQASWKKCNPDWQYYLWTEKEIDDLGLTNKNKYDAAINYGEKSDIARYEILYRFGGLYVDTDFECLQSFDLLHCLCDFYAGIAYDKKFIVFNGLIGSKPGHPILKSCIDALFSAPPRGNNSVTDIMTRTGPYFFTSQILEHIHAYEDKIVLFPVSYFYPWPNYSLDVHSRDEIERWFKPESLAVHHWHRSWFVK